MDKTNEERLEKVQKAVDVWVKQMVDFGGNNRLLFYRELKAGTLNLSPGKGYSEATVTALCTGGAVDSTDLIEPIGSSYETEEERDAAIVSFEALAQDTARRLKAVQSKGVENLEERGVSTTFVANGSLTWRNIAGTAVPNAPVLLTPIEIKARSATSMDFKIIPTDEPELNPTLLLYLSEEQGIEIDGDAVLEAARDSVGVIDRQQVMDEVLGQCGAMPEVMLVDSVIVGNFMYSKMPMVQDLRDSVSLLADNDLVAAMAGVEGAISAIRSAYPDDIEPWETETGDPRDDFLILDADSSQHVAINRALRGESLVIQGPPGTGKSQTIANLIASLTADGQHVLFVAEKGAAIDAVAKNLVKVGLGEVMMNLHGRGVTKKDVAQLLQQALKTLSRVKEPDLSDMVDDLDRSRRRLGDYDRALHQKDRSFDTSYFEARVLAHEAGGAGAAVKIPADALAHLDQANISAGGRALLELAELGRGAMLRDGNPWAKSSISAINAADAAMQKLGELRDSLSELGVEQNKFYGVLGTERDDGFAELRESIAVSGAYQEQASLFTDEVGSIDLEQLHASLEPAERTGVSRFFAGLFNGEYRTAKRQLRMVMKSVDGVPIVVAREAVRNLDESGRAFEGRFGGERRVANPDSLAGALDKIEGSIEAFRRHTAVDFAEPSNSAVNDIVDELEAQSDWAYRMPKINELEGQLREDGLLGAAHELLLQDAQPEHLAAELERSCYLAIAERLLQTTPELSSFNAATHSRSTEEFQEVDRSFLESSAERVKRAIGEHARNERNSHPEQNQLVTKEANKKTRHLPVRRIIDAAPDVIGALRPCWAMSPLAVSSLLPVRNDFFDVVIFDEASQVLPADAVPAIMRAKQVIVAGDTRQLPPTKFFASGDADGDGDDEEEEDYSLTHGFESILDVMNAALPNPAWLEWHYRSRDERLINFSNIHVYDSLLRTFPGVAGEGCIRKLTAAPEPDSTVAAVLSAVVQHVADRPERSLGVITTSAKMARAIEDRVFNYVRGLALDERPLFDRFLDPSNSERFFVKNIETVQGDERDDILLVVDLARSDAGRVYNRLGPLNYEGGERRLNVAVTRARRAVTLCTNFGFDDLAPSSFKSHGASLLREYTRYAETGGNDLGAEAADKPALNAFEIDVRDRLVAAGMRLTPQFGVAGYFIDFVAYHPDDPNRPVLAIEADGATYHSSPTARDRDRLRQQVLEGLGWTFHRIWSTAWFKDPADEVDRALRAWEVAVSAADQGLSAPSQRQARDVAPAFESVASDEDPYVDRGPCPIRVVPGLQITDYPMPELVKLIIWLESDGELRVDDELISLASAELGYRRKGRLIKDRLDRAIRIAHRRT